MSSENLMQSDIDYLKDMARSGQSAANLSGRFGLWWALLVIITLSIHWAIVTGMIGFEASSLGFLWMGFGVIGGLGSFILAQTIKNKPGQGSANNRVEGSIWPVTTIAIFTYAIAIGLSVGMRGLDPNLFYTIIPVAFFAYALAAAAVKPFEPGRPHGLYAILGIVFCGGSALLIGTAHILLVAILGVFVTQLLPAIAQLKNEPSDVV